MLNKIGSKDLEQTVGVKVDIDVLSGSGNSPIYSLIAKTLNVPHAQVVLKVQRPVVYVTAEERSLGSTRSTQQITNKLKNLLANNGFEFTDNKPSADLWFDVKSDSEKGTVSGSIYITYLTGVIKVMAVKEGKGDLCHHTGPRKRLWPGLRSLERGLPTIKLLETLEKDKISELLDTVLQ